MQEFIEIVRDLANEPSVSVSFQRIDDFHKLVVDQLPYGQIDQSSLVQGLIEFDGPAQDPPNLKKPLQWHFGGIAYEVCKAIRIQYAYQKYVDGDQLDADGSLFIGYGLGTPYREALAAATAAAEKTATALRSAVAKSGKSAGAEKKATDAENAFKALVAANPATASGKSLTGSAQDLLASLRTEYVNSPRRVTALAKYVDTAHFDTFLVANFPFQQHQSAAWQAESLSTRLAFETSNSPPGVRVEYDGPARDYDSHRPFPYTTDTLFNDPSGMYDKLLWWYFGGKAFRITKAMRLQFDDPAGNTGSLLVGYQGPGPH